MLNNFNITKSILLIKLFMGLVIGKLIPPKFYGFKIISLIIFAIRELIRIFGYKLLYIFIFNI